MMILKTVLNKTKNLSPFKFSFIIVYTVLVIFGTLAVNLEKNSEFINITLPTWLTAIGTISAVSVAVGQMLINQKVKTKENNLYRDNSTKFINSFLSEHTSKFYSLHNIKYDTSDNDLIINGDLEILINIYKTYKEKDIENICDKYLDDLKFAIKNIGLQADEEILTSLSSRLILTPIIKDTMCSLDSTVSNYKKRYDTSIDIQDFRIELRAVAACLSVLKDDIIVEKNNV